VGRTIAVANQKGGVAKTTTVHSLAMAMAEQGKKVLAVDLDPQASLTYAFGVDPDTIELSLHDVLLRRTKISQVIIKDGPVHLVPSTIDLAGAEMHLLTKTGREYVLRKALAKVTDEYDVIFIDCPPSLGILTINGLTAADSVIVPLQCETLGQRGVGQLLETIDDVRDYTNPDLKVTGAIAVMFDGRTNLAHAMVAKVREEHGIKVLEPFVPKSVRVAEAPGQGRSVLEHAPRSKSAEAYRALAKVVLKK
jgi:chromosome partitioning protein